MYIYIDKEYFTSKPSIEYCGVINSRIRNKGRVEVTNEELLDYILKGYSTSFGIYVGNNTDNQLYTQDYVAVDIDNTKENKPMFTIEQAKNDLFISNNALFLYTTLQHTEDHPRFRIVFKLSTQQKSKESIAFIYKKLLERVYYMNFDSSCSHASRFFLGTNPEDNYHHVFNMMNTLSVEDLISDNRVPTYSKVDYNSPTWELMQEQTLEADMEIKRRWKKYNKQITVVDNNQAKEYIKTLNIAELLGLPQDKAFNDILDRDVHPSAKVYLFEDKVYLYHRFNHKDSRDIFSLVSEIRGISLSNSLSYLCNLLNVQFDKDNEYLQNIKQSVEQFRYDLMTLDLSEVNPNAHKFLKDERSQRGFIMASILDVLQYSVILINNKPEMISDLSVRELSMRIFGNTKSRNRINQCLKVLNLIGVIETLDNKGIPKEMLTNLLIFQKNNQYSKRTSVHKVTGEYHNLMSNNSVQVFDEIKEKGINSNSLTKEGIELTLGKEQSDKLFVQDRNRDISDSTKDIQDIAIKYIVEQIEVKDYIEENKVIEYIVENTNYSKYRVTQVLKKSRHYFTSGYGLYFDRLNKELKEQLGITKYSYKERPTIYHR